MLRHDKWRVAWAVKRFLTPFTYYERTAGLERGWHDLTLADRKRAVRWGLGTERIWLGTTPHSGRTIRVDTDDADDNVLPEPTP